MARSTQEIRVDTMIIRRLFGLPQDGLIATKDGRRVPVPWNLIDQNLRQRGLLSPRGSNRG